MNIIVRPFRLVGYGFRKALISGKITPERNHIGTVGDRFGELY